MAGHSIGVQVCACAYVGRVPLSELAVSVVSPALQDPAVQYGAGVVLARVYLYRGPSRAKVDGGQVIPHLA